MSLVRFIVNVTGMNLFIYWFPKYLTTPIALLVYIIMIVQDGANSDWTGLILVVDYNVVF